MTSRRAIAYFGGASLMLAWLAVASGDARRPRQVRAPSQPGDAAVLATIATDVQAQAARLRQRLATAPAPAGPLRNPFAFEAPRVRAGHRAQAPIVAPAEVPVPPAEPVLVLIGIAEQAGAAGRVRTAMISNGTDDLLMVAEGQAIGERYRVMTIGADVVELKDVTTGATRRLALQL